MIQSTNSRHFLDKIRLFSISFLFVIFGMFCVKNLTYGAEISDVKIGDFIYSLDESTQTATVKKCDPGFWDKLFGSITIPEEVKYENKKYSVKIIGREFLRENKNIKEITGNSIEKIDRYAFYSSSLTAVSFPNATYVGDCAFCGCNKLKKIYLPSAIYIKWGAFKYCNNLVDINLPKVTEVESCAFWDCRNATNINLPCAEQIGTCAFFNCRSLKNITLPSVIKITYNMFENCVSLKSIILPKARCIENITFTNCESLEYVEIPNLQDCSKDAFLNLLKIVTFKIPASMRNFGLEKFENSDKTKIIYIDWGEKIINNDIINYVDESGKTSAEITGNEIIWLKETSENSSAWYAIDNSDGIFKPGSKFWVKWLSPKINKKEFYEYYNKLDKEHKKQVEKNKLWIFLTGVTDPDGNEYTNFDKNINYYVQLGEDWEKNDIKAVFIDNYKDDVLEVSYENLEFPEGKSEFAKLSMKHFSPYAIYDNDKNISNINSGVISKVPTLIFIFLISLSSIKILRHSQNE